MRHLRNDKLRNLYYLHNIFVAIEDIAWAGHAARMEQRGKNSHKPNAKISLAMCSLMCEWV